MRLYLWLFWLLLAQMLNAASERKRIHGIIFIGERPAYVVPKGHPLCADVWYLTGTFDAEKSLSTKSPHTIHWATNQLVIPKDYVGAYELGNLKFYSYRVTDDIGYLSEDNKNWEPVKLTVLEKKPKRIDKRKIFLSRILFESSFFSGTYDIVQIQPIVQAQCEVKL